MDDVTMFRRLGLSLLPNAYIVVSGGNMEKINPINFKIIRKNGYYTYHLPISTQVGILEDGLIDHHLDDELCTEIASKLGLCSQLIWDDDPYLYVLMLRYLFKNKSTILISDNLKNLHQYYSKEHQDEYAFNCHWSNRIEYTYDDESGFAREFGFVSTFEFAKMMNYIGYRKNKDSPDAVNWKYEAIKLSSESLKYFYNSFHSDVTSWCFLSGKNIKYMKNKLIDASKQPTVEEIMDDVEIMITFQLGDDEGYEGYMIIYSKNNILDKIKDMENMVVDFGIKYENFLTGIKNMENDFSNQEIFAEVEKFLNDFDIAYNLQ